MTDTLRSIKTFTRPVNWITTSFMLSFTSAPSLHSSCSVGNRSCSVRIVWGLAGSLGIGMGYHRLLTHRGYKTPNG